MFDLMRRLIVEKQSQHPIYRLKFQFITGNVHRLQLMRAKLGFD